MKNNTGNESWDIDPTCGLYENLSEEVKARMINDPDLMDEIYAEIEDELYSGYLEDGHPFLRRLFSRCPCKDSWVTLCGKKGEKGVVVTLWFDRSDPLLPERL